MFITRIALPRRTFLRGMGVTLGLPLLDAMVPALSAVADTPARPVRRVGFVYLPNGVAMNFRGVTYWRRPAEARTSDLSPIRPPLPPFPARPPSSSGLT